jgi:hypothetical protein
LFVASHLTISPSWLVELTETTLVLMAGREVEFDVLIPPGELVEHPAQADAVRTKRAIQPVRTEGPYSAVRPLV